jgi:hypothetical protein
MTVEKDIERARRIRQLELRRRGGENEVVHLASWHGDICELCGAGIIGPYAPKRYREGDRVVVVDEDPNSSWVTPRPVTCKGKG